MPEHATMGDRAVQRLLGAATARRLVQMLAALLALVLHSCAASFLGLVASGECHSCVVTRSGAILCWGCNNQGQTNPQPGVFNQVAAAYMTTCGIRPYNSRAVCWGGSPRSFADSVTQVCVGFDRQCILRERGSVYCSVDTPDNNPSSRTDFVQISCGWDYVCGRTAAGQVVCWGSRSSASLAALGSANEFAFVSAGGSTLCAIRFQGTLICVGGSSGFNVANANGPYIAVSAGYWAACGVRLSGNVDCWSVSSSTVNTYGVTSGPAGGALLNAISCDGDSSGDHCCGILTTGGVICWGSIVASTAVRNASLVGLPCLGGSAPVAVSNHSGINCTRCPSGSYAIPSYSACEACGVGTESSTGAAICSMSPFPPAWPWAQYVVVPISVIACATLFRGYAAIWSGVLMIIL